MNIGNCLAVIFDIDGTLIDSVDFHTKAWQEAMLDFGRETNFAEVRFQIGKGSDQLMPVFFAPEEIDRIGKSVAKRCEDIYLKKYLTQVRKFAKTRDLFLRILAEGKKVALATSAQKTHLERLKTIADISDLVKAETTSDDVNQSKPQPDIFAAALRSLGNPDPQRTIVIGDTPYDIEAAAKLDLRTIAVRSGGFPEDSLSGAAEIYDDVADLLAHYDTSLLRG